MCRSAMNGMGPSPMLKNPSLAFFQIAAAHPVALSKVFHSAAKSVSLSGRLCPGKPSSAFAWTHRRCCGRLCVTGGASPIEALVTQLKDMSVPAAQPSQPGVQTDMMEQYHRVKDK